MELVYFIARSPSHFFGALLMIWAILAGIAEIAKQLRAKNHCCKCQCKDEE